MSDKSRSKTRFGVMASIVVAIVGGLMALSAPAFADSPNPASISGSAKMVGNNVVVTVQGTWTWSAKCDSKVTGWAVDWNDGTGFPVGPSKAGVSMKVGDPDNKVHYNNPNVCTGANVGKWGPETHTYNGVPNSLKACVITYHVDPKSVKGGHSAVAGGPDRNDDNSLEENNFDSTRDCFTFNKPNTPTISTAVTSPSVTVGTSIGDVAQLAGGNNPTGTISFTAFYDPPGVNKNCVGQPAFGPTAGVTLTANKSATSPTFVAQAAGTYRWIATYSGDLNNPSVSGACNDANEVTTVSNRPVDPNSAINIVKTGTNRAHQGDDISYSFAVKNIGDLTLTNVSVDDDKLGHIGDINTLAVGQTVTLHKAAIAPASDVRNVAKACGTDTVSRVVCDTDDHIIDIIHTNINVTKSGPARAHGGDTVTYTFVVENTGSETLAPVTVTDNVLGEIGTLDSLAPGQKKTLTKDFKIPAGAKVVDNKVQACGDDPTGKAFCDTDIHHLVVIDPAIQILKSATPTSVDPGQATTYIYVVKNLGDTTLTDVVVTDDILGTIGTIDSLAPGESKTLTKTVTIQSDSPRTNVGTACAVDALQLRVCDDDSATITIVLPQGPQGRLPATGFNSLLWIAFGTMLCAAGLAMLRTRQDWLNE